MASGIHVKGVDDLIRKFDRLDDRIEEALNQGTQDAADHLIEAIEDKFGEYQNTGGDRNGPWKKLGYMTRLHKRKYGTTPSNSNKPLVDTSDMMFSFFAKTRSRTRKHTVTVSSDDEKILYHMYGAPSVNLPRRDPVRPTEIEEREECLRIISEAVREALDD